MINMKKLICLSLLILNTACSTMHFTQNNSQNRIQSDQVISKWHNTTLNGMVEISHPVNLYKECNNQPWQRVTVELGAKEGAASIITDSLVDAVIPGMSLVNLYTPWHVQIQCTKPSPIVNSLLKQEL